MSGPDVYAHAIQNRLSIYLYARLLWNPDEPMSEVIGDWCQTVFGAAAAPMRDYFQAMDRAWTGMPIHATILGNALNAAPHLLTDRLRSEAAAAFVAAERRLPEIAEPAARDRAAGRLAVRKRAPFNQWLDLYRMHSDTPRVSLPLLASAGDFPASASRPLEFVASGSGNELSTQVRLVWTNDALLVKWNCRDPRIKEVEAASQQHGGKAVEDDRVERRCPPVSPAKPGTSR